MIVCVLSVPLRLSQGPQERYCILQYRGGVVRDLGKDQTAAGKEWSSQGDLEGRRMATRSHRGT